LKIFDKSRWGIQYGNFLPWTLLCIALTTTVFFPGKKNRNEREIYGDEEFLHLCTKYNNRLLTLELWIVGSRDGKSVGLQ